MPTLMRQINLISRCAERYRAQHFKDLGLCSPHHSYLLAICKNPGISQEQLAEHICVDKSNVTRQLTFLENAGYIERKVCQEDKRITLVYPTEKAQEVLPSIRNVISSWNAYITQDLTEEEEKLLGSLIEKVCFRARQCGKEQEA